MDIKAYLSKFSDEENNDKHKLALTSAIDTRKFEIELYWKRATYFWTFIGASLAGFFLLDKEPNSNFNALVVACLGFIFSLGWYFVNRGSAYWQQNWEHQVDILEDNVIGPLYKTQIEKSDIRFFNLVGPYRFSPSRLNTLLSLIVSVAWLILIFRKLFGANELCHFVSFETITIVATLGAIAALAIFGQSRSDRQNRSVKLTERAYTDTETS